MGEQALPGCSSGGGPAGRIGVPWGTHALWVLVDVDSDHGECQSRRRRSVAASTFGAVTRAAESSPALRGPVEGVAGDTAVRLLRAASY